MTDDAQKALQPYYDILEALETLNHGDFEVTPCEADFIDELLYKRPGRLSSKQKGIIERMDEQYLQGRNRP